MPPERADKVDHPAPDERLAAGQAELARPAGDEGRGDNVDFLEA